MDDLKRVVGQTKTRVEVEAAQEQVIDGGLARLSSWTRS